MAETKTKATAIDAKEFIAAVPDAIRRADAERITAIMQRLSGEPPKMWGPSMVGFGEYTYQYASGHGGTTARLAFSPRAKELVLYLSSDGYAGKEAQLAALGKHRIGKACLYIKKLADVDEAVLEEMIADSLAWMDKKYPRG